MSDLRLYRRGRMWWVSGTVRLPGRDTGMQVRESTGAVKLRDAEAYRDALRKRILDTDALGAHGMTFAECVVVYLSRGGEKRFLRPLVERFGETRIRDISPTDVASFAAGLYAGCTPETVRRQLYVPLNAALRAGCDAHRVPVVRFDPPKLRRRGAVEHAPEDWFPQFFAAAPFGIAALVLFLTTTGTRVSEACRLTAGDCILDGERPVARLRRTKSGQPRTVPLTETLARAMRGLVEGGGLKPHERLFGYTSRFGVRTAIRRVCERSGLRYYSTHQLGRHAFAARLLARGGTLKEVQEAGGWASIQVVSEVYGHLEKKAVDQAVLSAGDTLTCTPLVQPQTAHPPRARGKAKKE